jgi:3-hydroxyisobutyrate dehydrogenase-like beta-hydroxyacid dehydrogenase
MTKIAFLGLGMMGTPMATRLLDAGHDLTVWDRMGEKTTKVSVDRGAIAANSPAEAAAGVDVAITMLANPEVLEGVVFGGGLAGALGAGQMLMDMSTVGPDEIRSVRERVPEGVIVVDAPVRGSVPEATGGTLDIFVGATDEVFERVRGILESLGTVHHVGGPGAGAAAKMVANSVLGAAMVAVGEALSVGEIFGLDHTVVLDVLAGSPVGPTARAKRGNIESGTYPPSFKLSLARKDMRLVTEAAGRAGRDLKLADASRAWLDEAAEAGASDLDFSAVVATILGDRPHA